MRDFIVDGVTYNCAEQYMMQQKALLFGDKVIAEEIMKAAHPSTQQDLGRKASPFDGALWDANCKEIVFKGNLAKFSQHEDLKELLLSYGDRTFVEASKKDKIWGIGMYSSDPGVEDPANWLGTNFLGEVVTRVRDELKK